MKINWKELDRMLIGEAESDDVTDTCKEEIYKFAETHDFGVFSDESLEQLAGIFRISIGPAYEAVTGTKIPNVFHHLAVSEPEEGEEADGER